MYPVYHTSFLCLTDRYEWMGPVYGFKTIALSWQKKNYHAFGYTSLSISCHISKTHGTWRMHLVWCRKWRWEGEEKEDERRSGGERRYANTATGLLSLAVRVVPALFSPSKRKVQEVQFRSDIQLESPLCDGTIWDKSSVIVHITDNRTNCWLITVSGNIMFHLGESCWKLGRIFQPSSENIWRTISLSEILYLFLLNSTWTESKQNLLPHLTGHSMFNSQFPAW